MLTTFTNQAYDGLVEKKAWDYYSLNSSDTKRSCRSGILPSGWLTNTELCCVQGSPACSRGRCWAAGAAAEEQEEGCGG